MYTLRSVFFLCLQVHCMYVHENRVQCKKWPFQLCHKGDTVGSPDLNLTSNIHIRVLQHCATPSIAISVLEFQAFYLFLYYFYIYISHYTEVHFAIFLSGGFTTMRVINLPERKLAKRTSVHCPVLGCDGRDHAKSHLVLACGKMLSFIGFIIFGILVRIQSEPQIFCKKWPFQLCHKGDTLVSHDLNLTSDIHIRVLQHLWRYRFWSSNLFFYHFFIIFFFLFNPYIALQHCGTPSAQVSYDYGVWKRVSICQDVGGTHFYIGSKGTQDTQIINQQGFQKLKSFTMITVMMYNDWLQMMGQKGAWTVIYLDICI